MNISKYSSVLTNVMKGPWDVQTGVSLGAAASCLQENMEERSDWASAICGDKPCCADPFDLLLKQRAWAAPVTAGVSTGLSIRDPPHSPDREVCGRWLVSMSQSKPGNCPTRCLVLSPTVSTECGLSFQSSVCPAEICLLAHLPPKSVQRTWSSVVWSPACQEHSSAGDNQHPPPKTSRSPRQVHLGDVTASIRKHAAPLKHSGGWWDSMCAPQTLCLHFHFSGYNATRYWLGGALRHLLIYSFGHNCS